MDNSKISSLLPIAKGLFTAGLRFEKTFSLNNEDKEEDNLAVTIEKFR